MPQKRRDSKGRVLLKGETQRKDGRYSYRYTDAFGKRREIYSNRLVEADKDTGRGEKALRTLEKEVISSVDLRLEKCSLNEYAERYFSTRYWEKKSTEQSYRRVYEYYVKDLLGSKDVSEVKNSDIRLLYQILLSKNNLSYLTIRMLNTLLKQIFDLAYLDDMVKSNPTTNTLSAVRTQKTAHKVRALTREEQSLLLSALDSTKLGKRYGAIYRVLLGTGMRASELAGLTWDDCDFSKHVINIRRILVRLKISETWTYAITLPKTKSSYRTIPMIPEVEETLKTVPHKPCTPVDGVSNFVFVNTWSHPTYLWFIEDTLNKIVNSYNQNGAEKLPHITPHMLRHTFCTRLFESGVNQKAIQAIMGHSTIAMTLDVYTDLEEDIMCESLDGIENIITPILRQTTDEF